MKILSFVSTSFYKTLSKFRKENVVAEEICRIQELIE